ncbi:FtsX-like permease family protein [Legionella israelensis]|uniref:Cell division protein FtsX n=1 Tax=Legionella israelensis TaxID=454 RepID=A0AAX1EE68_9GAMM|nr:permease-like cell division protein FtsX [Legionella israelensis]QBR83310.1 FtsX-like permease family protein [Legionella israelensis]
MLNTLRSLFSCHCKAASHSLSQLCQKPFSTFMTVFIIAVAITLPTLFGVFIDNMGRLTQSWQRNGNISLYLKTTLSEAEQQAVLTRVQNMPGVGQATLKSADKGLQELSRQEGMQDIIHYLPANPLPAVVEVVPALAVHSPAQIEKLYLQLKVEPGVELAKLDLQWINRLYALLDLVADVANAFILMLSLAVILIIGNTLRLSLYHQREEIQVLKLIGATDPFILRPFLYAGIWYGLGGAVIAVLLVNIFILSLGMAVNAFIGTYQMSYPFYGMSIRQILFVVIFASILGWFGARLSVKRQLTLIEPYK